MVFGTLIHHGGTENMENALRQPQIRRALLISDDGRQLNSCDNLTPPISSKSRTGKLFRVYVD